MMATIRLDRPGAPIGIGKGWGPVIANFAKLPTWQGLAPQQNRRVSFSPMKAPALILLLLLMLAPRLNAAMPHALACASPAAAGMTAVVGEHSQHAPATADHHGGHHEHEPHHAAGTTANAHTGHPAPADLAQTDLAQTAFAQAESPDTNDADNCQHCGQCEEHCSALLVISVLSQNPPQISGLQLSNTGDQRAGFSHDLNRPPRTSSL